MDMVAGGRINPSGGKSGHTHPYSPLSHGHDYSGDFAPLVHTHANGLLPLAEVTIYDFNENVDDWTIGGGDGVLDWTTDQHYGASAGCARITAPGAPDLDAGVSINNWTTTVGRPLAAEETVGTTAQVRSAATSRTARLRVLWLTGALDLLGMSYGPDVATSTSAWTELTFQEVAPVGAEIAITVVEFLGAIVESEVHYIGRIAFQTDIIPDGWALVGNDTDIPIWKPMMALPSQVQVDAIESASTVGMLRVALLDWFADNGMAPTPSG